MAQGSEKKWHRLVSAAVASGTAELCTLPIDLVKVRLQLQVKNSPASTVYYNGTIHAIKSIIRSEGVLSLWKGCGPSLVRQIGYTSVSMTLYQPIRDTISGNGDATFANKFLAGGMAGSIGISIFNPVEVIKVRLQADAKGKHYPNLIQGLRSILQTEGIPGLWRGIFPNVQRAFIVNAAELGSYDQAKQTMNYYHPTVFRLDAPVTHLTASIFAGFFGAVGSNPVDIVKTRLMKQEGKPLSKNPIVAQWRCAYNIVTKEGAGSLYNGFIPNWMRKGPWSILFFLTYEQYLLAMKGT